MFRYWIAKVGQPKELGGKVSPGLEIICNALISGDLGDKKVCRSKGLSSQGKQGYGLWAERLECV
jgi:hypothetical protein